MNWKKYSDAKDKFMGERTSNASHKLHRQLMLNMARQLGLDDCFQCGEKIETVEEFSVEHKKPWLWVDKALFWDLDNIAYSHQRCNFGAARPSVRIKKHGTASTYSNGCRCDPCRDASTSHNRKYREERRETAYKKLAEPLFTAVISLLGAKSIFVEDMGETLESWGFTENLTNRMLSKYLRRMGFKVERGMVLNTGMAILIEVGKELGILPEDVTKMTGWYK